MSSHAQGSNRRVRLVVVVVLGAVAGLLLFFSLRTETQSEDHNQIASVLKGTVRDKVIAKEQVWAARAGFQPIDESSLSELAAGWKTSIDDPDNLFNDEETQGLMATLSEHILARTERSPDRYLQLCERESLQYRWLPLSDNVALDRFWAGEVRKPRPSAESRDLLEPVWRRYMDEEGDRFAEVGIPPDGARIVVRKVRSREQADDLFFTDDEDFLYWWGAFMTTNALSFRSARPTLEEVLENHPGVVVAQCQFLIRCANGHLINWASSWFIDPQTGRWVCGWMAQKRSRLTLVVF